jgi:vancomycin resistance protein YoaR
MGRPKGVIIGVVAAGALTAAGIAAAVFWGRPHLRVTNSTSTAALVEIQTDVGEVYASVSVPARDSVTLQVSGRDKLLWLVVHRANGQLMNSKSVYVTTGISVSSNITDDSVTITHGP